MSRSKFDLEFGVVTGQGEFPWDMLRYDHCVPAMEIDSGALPEIWPRAVVVKRYSGQPGGWTEGRWDSFGWKLLLPFKGVGFENLGDAVRTAEQWRAKL